MKDPEIHHFLGLVQNNGAEACSGLGSCLRDALSPDLNTVALVAWHGCCIANVSDDCDKKGAIMFGMRIRKSILLTVTAAIAVGAFATSASAQEVDAKALLEQMSAEIAGLDNFIVHW